MELYWEIMGPTHSLAFGTQEKPGILFGRLCELAEALLFSRILLVCSYIKHQQQLLAQAA